MVIVDMVLPFKKGDTMACGVKKLIPKFALSSFTSVKISGGMSEASETILHASLSLSLVRVNVPLDT